MGAHSGHGQQICEFGTVHSRCRCIDDAHIWIKCPDPDACALATGIDPKYTPKHRESIHGEHREVRIDP